MGNTAGSQPTYEELKLEGMVYDGDLPECSQPTYEELKPVVGIAGLVGLGVPSLPMRN